MTAQSTVGRLALAAVAGLIFTTESLAETRLMSDSNGVVISAAPADGSAVAPYSIPNTPQGVAKVAPAVADGDPPVAGSATEAPARAKLPSPDSGQDPAPSGSATARSAPEYVPAPSWLSRAKQFVAGLVLSSGK